MDGDGFTPACVQCFDRWASCLRTDLPIHHDCDERADLRADFEGQNGRAERYPNTASRFA